MDATYLKFLDYEIYSDATVCSGRSTLSKQPGSSKNWQSLVIKRKNSTYKLPRIESNSNCAFSFKAYIRNSSVRWDNTAAISYINKYWSYHNVSLNYLSRQILLWYIDNKISITAVHIPRLDNQVVKTMPRKVSDKIE